MVSVKQALGKQASLISAFVLISLPIIFMGLMVAACAGGSDRVGPVDESQVRVYEDRPRNNVCYLLGSNWSCVHMPRPGGQ